MTDTASWLTSLQAKNGARTGFVLAHDVRNPDEVAEAVTLGDELGIPANIVGTDPKAFRVRAETARNTTALSGAPMTAQWIKDTINSGLAKDDLDNLTWLEQNGGALVRGAGRGVRSIPAIPKETGARIDAQMAGDIGKTAEQIYHEELTRLGPNALPEMRATARMTAQARFEAVDGLEAPDRDELLQRGAESLKKAREILSNAGDIPMSEGAAGFRDGDFANAENSVMGVLKAFADNPLGGVAFVAETAAEVLPILLASTAVTAVTKAPAAGIATMAGGSFLTENSRSAMEFLQEKGFDLTQEGIAFDVMNDADLMAEAADRGLTRGMVIALMDAVSGGIAGKQILSSPAGDAVAQAVAQAMFGGAGEAAAQMAAGQDLDVKEVVIEGLAEFATAPIEVGGVAGRGLLRQFSRAAKSGTTAERLQGVDERVAQSKLKGRSPTKFKEFMERLGHGPLYVPADDLNTFFQAKDIGPEDFGINLAEFEGLLESGGDVPVSMATYAAQISGTEDAAWFQQYGTFDPSEMSMAEAELFNAEVSDVMTDAFEEAEALRKGDLEARASDEQVFDGAYTQLREAGRTKDVAENEARVMTAFFRTMSERYGEDALDLARRFGLEIRGPQSDPMRLRGNLDIALNTLRAGRKPKEGSPDLDELDAELSRRGLDIALSNDELAEALGSATYEQPGKRGAITFPAGGVDSGQTVVNLFENADLSTFLHEAGHYFLEAFSALAADEAAPQAMRDDLAVIQNFLGAEGAFATEHHEKWARGFEAYLMEGKAPSLELASAFARFKAWMTRIYRSIAQLNVNLSPEIRDVMDRMLATDAEIAAAREAQQINPLFTDQAAAGMSDTSWGTYQRMARASEEQAQQALLEKSMAKVRREKEKWWKDERKDVRRGVEQTVNSRREYRLIEMLANQRWIGQDGETPDFQIDRAALTEQFGDGVLAELQRSKFGGKRAIYGKDGASPQEIADFFGFANASEMVEVLQNTIKRRAAIEQETDRIMLDRYGDPLNDGTIEEEALAAIHSDQQAQTVATEVRHLAGKAGLPVRNMTARIFRQRAQAMIGRMSVQEATRPDAFLAAGRKAAKRAEDAFASVARGRNAKEALTMAARHKEQQLLNHYLYMEARDLSKVVASKREKMRNYAKKSVREKLEGGYIEQIDALLDQYDFRVRSSGQVARSESLRDFVARMEEAGRGAELNIDQRLLEQAQKVHYSRLSVDELRGLFDTIENIDHLGRFKQKLIEAQRKRDLEESVSRVIGQVRTNHSAKDPSGKFYGLQFLNLIRRPDTIMVSLDGGAEMGPVYDELKRSVDEGQAREQKMGVEIVGRMDALFKRHYDAKTLRAMQKPTSVPGEVTREWTKAEILAVALNTGNENNFQRLMDPSVNKDSVMTPERLDALLAKLDDNDWQFIQGMWDEINTLWPELAAIHKRRTGVEPEKVEAKLMVQAPGGVRGGYYPIAYDPTRGALAARDEASLWDKYSTAGHGSTAAVKNGMTMQRQKTGGGRTLLFDLSVPFGHMRDTVRYIALSEAVDASHRILNHPALVETMQQHGQAETHKTLNLWLKDTARGPIYNTDLLNASARFVKNNFTLSRLAFNMKTVILQATGLGQSAAVIGKREMARGMMTYLRHPQGMIGDVTQRSALMAERQSTFQKDIYDFVNDTKTAGPMQSRWRKGKTAVAKAGFWPMIKMQFLVVDMPTWVGAYGAALERGESEDRAVHYADRMVVRAQDSGLFADRAAVERGTVRENVIQADIIRVFTTLAGYMLTKNNRAQVTLMQARAGLRDADSSLGKLAVATSAAGDLMLLFAFEAVAMGLLYALTAEDDDDLTEFMLTETGMAVVGGIPMVRDAASAFRGYGGGGVYGSVMEDIGRLAVQIGQGELDADLFRSIVVISGTGTGLPTTASLRAIEGLLDDDRSPAEALFGRNPLDAR